MKFVHFVLTALVTLLGIAFKVFKVTLQVVGEIASLDSSEPKEKETGLFYNVRTGEYNLHRNGDPDNRRI